MTVLLIVGSITGIAIFTWMEYDARAALPVEQQTAAAIERIYDGAVCLACDLGRIAFAMFGSAAVFITLASWAVYEIVGEIRARSASFK